MYEIEQGELPQEFTFAWQCAGQHIQKMGQEGVQWLRANLNPPVIIPFLTEVKSRG